MNPEPRKKLNPNLFRLLVSTDNHLGFLERHPVRGHDSFAAFEEMLLHAKSQEVDFVLLGGDLFHENKPSRLTLYRTMEILRRHCMGEKAVKIEVISDEKIHFRNGKVNYKDANYNVGLPVFSIHGNHDDPTREGAEGDSLAALDLLHVTNLVNYFGKGDNSMDGVVISPIMLRKGTSRLALYGLGNMRDERLNRLWNKLDKDKKQPLGLVKFMKPKDNGEDESEITKVFVLHQNRDITGRGNKNCIREEMIPEWMDLVIWGHEHECIIDPVESSTGGYNITQPGSSVATSLIEGESVQKHVGLVRCQGKQVILNPLPLTHVRLFKMDSLDLSEQEGLDDGDLDPKKDELVSQILEDKVNEMLAELLTDYEEPVQHLGQEFVLQKPKLVRALSNAPFYFVNLRSFTDVLCCPLSPFWQPLIRLRVEHTGFTALNNQKFGSSFVGKVANPSDMLLFHRRSQKSGSRVASSLGGGGGATKMGEFFSGPLRPDHLGGDVKVEDLLKANLEQTGSKGLALFEDANLKDALEKYVVKQDTSAIGDMVQERLDFVLDKLRPMATADNAAAVSDAVEDITAKGRKKNKIDAVAREGPALGGVDVGMEDDDDKGDDEDADEPASPSASSSLRKKPAPSSKAKTTTKRGKGKGRSSSTMDAFLAPASKTTRQDDEIEMSDGDEEPSRPPPKKAAKSSSTSSTSKRPASQRKGKKSAGEVIDLGGEDNEVYMPAPRSGAGSKNAEKGDKSGKTSSSSRRQSSRAGKNPSYTEHGNEDVDDLSAEDSEEEESISSSGSSSDEVVTKRASKRGRKASPPRKKPSQSAPAAAERRKPREKASKPTEEQDDIVNLDDDSDDEEPSVAASWCN